MLNTMDDTFRLHIFHEKDGISLKWENLFSYEVAANQAEFVLKALDLSGCTVTITPVR